MTREEFDKWLDYHCARFSKVREWMASLGSDQPATVEAWYEALNHLALADAQAASKEMHANAAEYKMLSRDAIPATIAGIASRFAPQASQPARRFVDGVETVNCLRCKDVGYVDVFHFGAGAAYRVEKGIEKPGDAGLIKSLRGRGDLIPLFGDCENDDHGRGGWACVVLCDCQPENPRSNTSRFQEGMIEADKRDWRDRLAESRDRIGGIQAIVPVQTRQEFDAWAP